MSNLFLATPDYLKCVKGGVKPMLFDGTEDENKKIDEIKTNVVNFLNAAIAKEAERENIFLQNVYKKLHDLDPNFPELTPTDGDWKTFIVLIQTEINTMLNEIEKKLRDEEEETRKAAEKATKELMKVIDSVDRYRKNLSESNGDMNEMSIEVRSIREKLMKKKDVYGEGYTQFIRKEILKRLKDVKDGEIKIFFKEGGYHIEIDGKDFGEFNKILFDYISDVDSIISTGELITKNATKAKKRDEKTKEAKEMLEELEALKITFGDKEIANNIKTQTELRRKLSQIWYVLTGIERFDKSTKNDIRNIDVEALMGKILNTIKYIEGNLTLSDEQIKLIKFLEALKDRRDQIRESASKPVTVDITVEDNADRIAEMESLRIIQLAFGSAAGHQVGGFGAKADAMIHMYCNIDDNRPKAILELQNFINIMAMSDLSKLIDAEFGLRASKYSGDHGKFNAKKETAAILEAFDKFKKKDKYPEISENLIKNYLGIEVSTKLLNKEGRYNTLGIHGGSLGGDVESVVANLQSIFGNYVNLPPNTALILLNSMKGLFASDSEIKRFMDYLTSAATIAMFSSGQLLATELKENIEKQGGATPNFIHLFDFGRTYVPLSFLLRCLLDSFNDAAEQLEEIARPKLSVKTSGKKNVGEKEYSLASYIKKFSPNFYSSDRENAFYNAFGATATVNLYIKFSIDKFLEKIASFTVQ